MSPLEEGRQVQKEPCLDVKHGAVIDHRCFKPKGHEGAHTDGSASWMAPQPALDESLRVMHARKQGAADGFQQGWHAVLKRLREGDPLDELSELVPRPPAFSPLEEGLLGMLRHLKRQFAVGKLGARVSVPREDSSGWDVFTAADVDAALRLRERIAPQTEETT